VYGRYPKLLHLSMWLHYPIIRISPMTQATLVISKAKELVIDSFPVLGVPVAIIYARAYTSLLRLFVVVLYLACFILGYLRKVAQDWLHRLALILIFNKS